MHGDLLSPLPFHLNIFRNLSMQIEHIVIHRNDVHHRSPGKSFLQPLVSLRGLVGSDRYKDDLEVMDPSYSSSVNVRNSNSFGGIENSVDTSWSFQVRGSLVLL